MRLIPKQFVTRKRVKKHDFEEDYNENGKMKLQQTTRNFWTHIFFNSVILILTLKLRIERANRNLNGSHRNFCVAPGVILPSSKRSSLYCLL